jgi:hypothetical protein
LFDRGTASEQEAAALALLDATDPDAERLLASHRGLAGDACASRTRWERLATAGN